MFYRCQGAEVKLLEWQSRGPSGFSGFLKGLRPSCTCTYSYNLRAPSL